MESIDKQKEGLLKRLDSLKGSLTGDMFKDMDAKDEIHRIEMKLNGTKPSDSHFDCEGCGS